MNKPLTGLSLILLLLLPVNIFATNQKNSPNIQIAETNYSFGELTPGQIVTHDFVIRNTGTANLTIHRVISSCICSKIWLEAKVIKPGCESVLKVFLDTTGKTVGTYIGKLTVYSDDSDEPVKVLQIKADIIESVLPKPTDSATITTHWKPITPQEAEERLKSASPPLLIDVRTPEEYREGHIPGSILIPLDNLAIEAPQKLSNQNSMIIVYCASGIRSKKAAQTLINLGYPNVYDLGGIQDWPYEVVK